jgi:phage terminase small subunit
MLKFIGAYNGPGSGTEAARIAGYSQPQLAAARLVKHPGVVAALKKKQDEVIKASGRKLGRAITKVDVVTKLAALADIDPAETNNNITGQVNALKAIAEIEGYIVKKTQDVTELAKGRSVEEMEHFAIHGYWPDEENAQSSKPGKLGAKTPDAGIDKPN